MNTRAEKIPPSTSRHWTRRLHRVLGLAASVILLLVTLTGLFISYADKLGLASRSAASPLMLALYDIEAPAIDAAYLAGELPVVSAGGVLVIDDKVLDETAGQLHGAVLIGNEVTVVTDRHLYLLTAHGQLIETLAIANDLGPTGLGVLDRTVVLATANGLRAFDSAGMQLVPLSAGTPEPRWARTGQLDAEQVAVAQQAVLSDSISWSRVMADIHSGRILPFIGPFLVDLSALCLLYLCGSGLYLGLRRR